MNKGGLVTVEGGHGVGKSRLVSSLVDALRDSGVQASGGNAMRATKAAEAITQLNLALDEPPSPTVESCLVAAALLDVVEHYVAPRLERGEMVIMERYAADAMIAFQHFGRGLPLDWLQPVTHYVTRLALPDLTLLLDMPASDALARVPVDERHRIEMEGLAFHEKVRRGYLSIAAANTDRVVVLDASKGAETVLQEALRVLERLSLPI